MPRHIINCHYVIATNWKPRDLKSYKIWYRGYLLDSFLSSNNTAAQPRVPTADLQEQLASSCAEWETYSKHCRKSCPHTNSTGSSTGEAVLGFVCPAAGANNFQINKLFRWFIWHNKYETRGQPRRAAAARPLPVCYTHTCGCVRTCVYCTHTQAGGRDSRLTSDCVIFVTSW